MTPEGQRAIDLANKVLDRVNADPDDDLAILARNLLRAVELIELEKQNNKAVAAAFDAELARRCGGMVL